MRCRLQDTNQSKGGPSVLASWTKPVSRRSAEFIACPLPRRSCTSTAGWFYPSDAACTCHHANYSSNLLPSSAHHHQPHTVLTSSYLDFIPKPHTLLHMHFLSTLNPPLPRSNSLSWTITWGRSTFFQCHDRLFSWAADRPPLLLSLHSHTPEPSPASCVGSDHTPDHPVLCCISCAFYSTTGPAHRPQPRCSLPGGVAHAGPCQTNQTFNI